MITISRVRETPPRAVPVKVDGTLDSARMKRSGSSDGLKQTGGMQVFSDKKGWNALNGDHSCPEEVITGLLQPISAWPVM